MTHFRSSHWVLALVIVLAGLRPQPAYPVSGPIVALAVDPVTPTTLYAGTSGGGVFKSMDGGGSWNAANVGLTASDVRVLAIDPQNPTTLYAGTYSGAGVDGDTVFKSTDGGASWHKVGMLVSWGDWAVITSAATLALAVDPQTPTTLYATGTAEFFWAYGDLSRHCMVFKSTDGGGSWNVVLESYLFYETADFSALAIDPQTPTTVYAGTLGRGTFKSTDGGASWITVLEPDRGGPPLVIDPQTPTTLYASGLVKSTDGGGSWSTILEPAVALAIDPQTPTTVYAKISSGLVKSTDGGGSWNTILEPAVPGSIALAIDPVTPTTLYAATEAGLFKSTDGGATWNPTSQSADIVAPDTTIGVVTDGNGASVALGAATLSRSVTFVFTGHDNIAVARFECRMDATNFVACVSPVTYPNLTIGSHGFEVRAIDTSGNSDGSPARHTLIIDTPPQTNIVSAVDHRGRPVPNGGTASTSITFRFGGSDNIGVAGFRCRVDGAGDSACTSPITYSPAAKGTHTFRVQAIDSNGFLDSTPASFTWRK